MDNDQSCKQSVQTAEENQQELLARNSELKYNGQEIDKAYQSLQVSLFTTFDCSVYRKCYLFGTCHHRRNYLQTRSFLMNNKERLQR